MGTIVYAVGANLGTAKATVGSTIFDGDALWTDPSGGLQVRTAAARVLLTASTHATWGSADGTPYVVLTAGNAVFSTANAKALALHASKAVFRPRDDKPMIGSVTLLNAKELVVRCSRGTLMIAVDDDVREIAEGTAYRVVLDANAPPPADVPQWGNQEPRRSGRSNFIWYAIAFTSVVTSIVVWKALESPDRPN